MMIWLAFFLTFMVGGCVGALVIGLCSAMTDDPEREAAADMLGVRPCDIWWDGAHWVIKKHT